MDISAEVAAIQAASQGSELRQPLVGALNKLNSGSLPAVTTSDAGKILKVGANGWEVGEKSGYMPVPSEKITITENGNNIDITDYALADISVSGGGSSVNLLSGVNMPESSDGINGDIYIRYTGDYIKNGTGQGFDTGYAPNPNTKIITIFKVTNSQTTAWPQVFGVRDSTGSDAGSFMFALVSSQSNYTNAMSTFGYTKTSLANFGANNLINKVTTLEVTPSKASFNVNGIKTDFNLNNAGQFSCQSHLCIFGLIAGGSFQSWSTLDNTELYSFQIFENNVLIHDYVPALDSNNVACLYDNVNSDYVYVNNGSVQKGNGGEIISVFAKVNGLWQPLIGTDIDDLNL